jgi:hypothetical protein
LEDRSSSFLGEAEIASVKPTAAVPSLVTPPNLRCDFPPGASTNDITGRATNFGLFNGGSDCRYNDGSYLVLQVKYILQVSIKFIRPLPRDAI